jgi:hypothetical protein
MPPPRKRKILAQRASNAHWPAAQDRPLAPRNLSTDDDGLPHAAQAPAHPAADGLFEATPPAASPPAADGAAATSPAASPPAADGATLGTVARHGRGFKYIPASTTKSVKDYTGFFVRFPDGQTGEAVQYQAMQDKANVYKGHHWRSSGNHQHLIVVNGVEVKHEVVSDGSVTWVVWLTSGEERPCTMLDAHDSLIFDKRVERYKDRLRCCVTNPNGWHHVLRSRAANACATVN